MLENKHIFLFLIHLLCVYGKREIYNNGEMLYRLALLEQKVGDLEDENGRLAERMTTCESEYTTLKELFNSVHNTDQRLVE